MYLVTLKTALTMAMRKTFESYLEEDFFQNVNVSTEYPVEEESFPCVWVNFTPTDDVQMIGINNREYLGELPPSAATSDATHAGYTRGYVEGEVSFTIGALSSLERDRLYDQVIRVGLFSDEDDSVNVFRQQIEQSPYANIGMVFDKWRTSGENAAPGTPWGTDEMIYEITLSTQLNCEFFVQPTTGDLILLSEINVEEPMIVFEPPAEPTYQDTWPGIGTPHNL